MVAQALEVHTLVVAVVGLELLVVIFQVVLTAAVELVKLTL